MPGTPIYIDIGTPADPEIIVASDAAFANVLTVIKKDNMDASSNYVANPGRPYPYPTKTWALIRWGEGKELSFDLQDVANQPTWTGGAQSDVTTFLTDIANSW